jgi:hypothetical protein
VIPEPYTKVSGKNGKKEVFLVTYLAMKSLLIGIGHYLYKVYNYYDSRACGYKRSGVLFQLDGLGMEWFSFGFALAVWSCVIYRILLWIPLCGIFLFQLNWVVLAYNLNIRR